MNFIATFRKLIVFTSICLMAAACLHDDKKDDSSAAGGSATSSLDGTWITSGNCEPLSGESRVETMVISNGTFALSQTWYSDTSCATLRELQTFAGTFVVDGNSADVSGAKKVTLTVVSGSITPKSAQNVTDKNNGSECGFTDWALDTEKDVMGTSCMPAGASFHDLMMVDTSVTPNTFKMGDDNTCDPTDQCAGGTNDYPTALEAASMVRQ